MLNRLPLAAIRARFGSKTAPNPHKPPHHPASYRLVKLFHCHSNALKR